MRRRDHAHARSLVYTLAGGAGRRSPGVLQFSKLSVGDPTVAVGLELDVIAAVIIGGGSLLGGRGTVVGTIVGAAIMTIIQIGCSQQGLPNWVQQIVTGGIIVAAVALDRWRVRRRALTLSDCRHDEDSRPRVLDLRFPTSRTQRRHRRLHPDPGLLGRVRHPARPTPASKGTASRSRSAAATRSAPRRSDAFRRSSSAGRSRRSPPTPPGSGDRSRRDSQLRWLGPEKGVIHLAHRGHRQRGLGSPREGASASRSGSCSPT